MQNTSRCMHALLHVAGALTERLTYLHPAFCFIKPVVVSKVCHLATAAVCDGDTAEVPGSCQATSLALELDAADVANIHSLQWHRQGRAEVLNNSSEDAISSPQFCKYLWNTYVAVTGNLLQSVSRPTNTTSVY